MDKKIKFNLIKDCISEYNILEIKFNKGILINNFTLKSKKSFTFVIIINGNRIFITDAFSSSDNLIESEYNSIDDYYYNFKFDSDIFIDSIKLLVKNKNNNIYLEYDDTNYFNSNDEIINKYLDQFVFTKKYYKFFTNNINDIQLYNIENYINVFNSKLGRGRIARLERIEIDKNTYNFKYLKDNTYYVEFDEIQNIKNDKIHRFHRASSAQRRDNSSHRRC
jgi:hypothetical protein